MREITDNREIQKIELEIFDVIHAFCEKRGLRYSLYGGTLIGAIRHKGFIPWDDDIDLIMPRPDYEIFCKEFKAEGFSVHTHLNDSNYIYPFAKVYHEGTVLVEGESAVKSCAFVDVFPIDGFPDNGKSLRMAKWVRRMVMLCVTAKNGKRWKRGLPWYKCIILLGIRSILFPISNCFLLSRFQQSLQAYGYDNQPIIGDMTWGYGACQCVPANVFSSFVDVEFECRKAKAMEGWDVYLTNVFGDYMKLPPPEKRRTHHSFRLWKKE